MNPEDFRATESIHIDASPNTVFDTITDIKRTGEWSPVVETCWWETEPAGDPQVGDIFFGRNVTPERTWETQCTVTAAERPTRFTWVVGDGIVNWGFELAPANNGTTLTELWEVTDHGFMFFENKYGADASNVLESRRRDALEGIPATLARIKEIIEQSD
ncbi:SRPBCC family protein [Corynebacterium freiburgense]|uniref:SRPBCC family protein n=1 Tax=Corynebacterium freiburgense TaxID=556548 RepID=UPI00041E0D2A|nr:SRPBCC family protein [Corynebacterium freiburgense]WJZ03547.1 Polyketide cyclase / dehydrase and lipid transport [Corynebacterium freiburgense]